MASFWSGCRSNPIRRGELLERFDHRPVGDDVDEGQVVIGLVDEKLRHTPMQASAPSPETGHVLITGATGYVAGWIVRRLRMIEMPQDRAIS